MNFNQTIEQAIQLDKEDQLSSFRDEFHIPIINEKESIYLCGNSLGLQPKAAKKYVEIELEDWAKLGVEGHLHGRNPWLPYHETLTKPMAQLVGAKKHEVVVMNSLTVNLHLLLVSFYRPNGKKRKILIEENAFPSDKYAVESHLKFHGFSPEDDLIIWRSKSEKPTLDISELEDILDKQGDEIALIMIGGVNYYTGQLFDIKSIASLGHKHDILVGIDLAHGAGNIPLELHDSGIDFAAWCSYKYLNSGPGSLSGIFVHERHADTYDIPRFAGWWGHNKETRFGMRDEFDPLYGAEGWQLSNPPILPLSCMRASLDIFMRADINKLHEKSKKLNAYLDYLLSTIEGTKITSITPKDKKERGCQHSISVKNADKALFDAITAEGVIADWREPDVIRIAPVPLYNSFMDLYRFTEILKGALNK